jgi:hypothetical protein
MYPAPRAGGSTLAFLVALVASMNAVPCSAATYNVFTASQLVSAVASANATLGPDIINLAAGYYLLDSNVTPINVTDDLTVNGAGRPGTVLDGGSSGGAAFDVHRSFTSDPANPNIQATFNNLTIENFHPGIGFSSGPTSLLLVSGTTITGSHTDAIEIGGGPVQILNSTLSGNGRGILIESGDSILVDNVTIADNVGNGIEKYGGPLTVRNSIIVHNAADCSGIPDSADHDIDGDGSCGSGFVTGDPLLGVLGDNGGPTWTYALTASSTAIDAGSGGEAVDQRGVARPQGLATDIGAFEWTSLPFKAVRATVSSGGSVTTDTLGTGATPADPVQSSVTAPSGGTITIEQGPGAAEFGFVGQQVQIHAVPDATPANPFSIVFVIDASVIPSGQSAATIEVRKNGAVVPPCTGSPGTASPDACVTSRQTIAGGDAQITVLSSTASTWDFASGGSLAAVTDLPIRLEFSVYPSPIRHDAKVRFSLPAAADVDLSLFDLSGRKLSTLVSGPRPGGSYSFSWRDADRLAPGLYFVRFRAGDQVRTTTVVRVN